MEKTFNVSPWTPVGGRERRTVVARNRSSTSSFGLGAVSQEITNTCRLCILRTHKVCGGLHGDAGSPESVFNATRKPSKDWPEGVNGTVFPCDTL